MEELVSGLLRPKLFPFGKLSKAKPAAHMLYNFFHQTSLLLNFILFCHEMAEKGPNFLKRAVHPRPPIVKIFGFAIRGLEHQRNLRNCDFRINQTKLLIFDSRINHRKCRVCYLRTGTTEQFVFLSWLNKPRICGFCYLRT